MNDSPWFPLYTGDFLTGTIDLEPDEVGIYIRLLCYQWEKGILPMGDPRKLARAAGISRDELSQYLPLIHDKFPMGRNQRLIEEQQRRDKQRENGKKGGRPKTQITDSCSEAEKQRARNLLNRAVKNGEVERPTSCPLCNGHESIVGTIQGHHNDYSLPLDVDWLCRKCHGERHTANQTQTKRKAPQSQSQSQSQSHIPTTTTREHIERLNAGRPSVEGYPTLKEAKNVAGQIGATEEMAEKWWIDREAQSWESRNGEPMNAAGWLGNLKAYAENWKANEAKQKKREANRPNEKKINLNKGTANDDRNEFAELGL